MSSAYPILISTCPMLYLADSFVPVKIECSCNTTYFHMASLKMPIGPSYVYAIGVFCSLVPATSGEMFPQYCCCLIFVIFALNRTFQKC